MDNNSFTTLCRKGYLVLGGLTAIALVGYGLSYVIAMPQVSPGGFVPTTSSNAGSGLLFGAVQGICILLYAFAFLPVNVMFTIKRHRDNPYALVFAACLLGVSLLLELVNNLPLVMARVYPVTLQNIPPDVALYLRQVETIRYLSYDVTGFTLAYAAILVYALVYFQSHRLLAYTSIASIILFVANVPCLWFAPNLAVILMSISVFAFAPVPILLARMAIECTPVFLL